MEKSCISEIRFIKESSTPIRVIKIKITRVINIKSSDNYSATAIDSKFEYIGRGNLIGEIHTQFVKLRT